MFWTVPQIMPQPRASTSLPAHNSLTITQFDTSMSFWQALLDEPHTNRPVTNPLGHAPAIFHTIHCLYVRAFIHHCTCIWVHTTWLTLNQSWHWRRGELEGDMQHLQLECKEGIDINCLDTMQGLHLVKVYDWLLVPKLQQNISIQLKGIKLIVILKLHTWNCYCIISLLRFQRHRAILCSFLDWQSIMFFTGRHGASYFSIADNHRAAQDNTCF